jgi:hypothetical protein
MNSIRSEPSGNQLLVDSDRERTRIGLGSLTVNDIDLAITRRIRSDTVAASVTGCPSSHPPSR